ncbi:MAG: hypothetical protein PWR01_220 [Clostridiales bacterium]|nr:hypothetical protein [Clostridiales bacterium]
MNQSKKITLSGVFIALGILLPIAFHAAGPNAGKIFLPMHIPVLLSGFVVGPVNALAVGIITPLLSSLLTGMPPMTPVPTAIMMAFELGAYGLLAGLFYQRFRWHELLCLIGAMLGGRIVLGLVVAGFVYVLGFKNLGNPAIYVWGGIVTGLPGMIIQLILIPGLIMLLKKSNVLKGGKSIES